MTSFAASRVGRDERRQQAHQETRRAILDAALELFVADGYASVSMRSLAAKVEYSPGAIYSYFGSKDEIFFALAEEGFRILGAGELAFAATDDPLDDVRQTVWRLYDFSRKHAQYFALVFLDRHVPRIGPASEQFAFMAALRAQIVGRIQRCIDAGIFPHSTRADMALRLLWAPIIGITSAVVSERMPPEVDADALVVAAIETTITGLRTPNPEPSSSLVPSCLGPSSSPGLRTSYLTKS